MSSYSAVIMSPSDTRSMDPEDSSVIVKYTVPSKIPLALFVSVTIRSIPPASESDQTSIAKLSIDSEFKFISASMTLTTPVSLDGELASNH